MQEDDLRSLARLLHSRVLGLDSERDQVFGGHREASALSKQTPCPLTDANMQVGWAGTNLPLLTGGKSNLVWKGSLDIIIH